MKSMSYKIMYVIVIVNDWEIEQMNVKTIFLYEKIKKNVYVAQSIDFEQNVDQVIRFETIFINNIDGRTHSSITWCSI